MKKKSEKKLDEAFALRFCTLMGNRRLTLKEISAKTGNAVSTISTWKNGRLPKSKTARMKVARIFGVSQAFLFQGDKDINEIIFSNEAVEKSAGTSGYCESEIIECVRRMIKCAVKKDGNAESLLRRLRKMEKIYAPK